MKNVKFVSTCAVQKGFASAVRQNVNNYFKEQGISPKGNSTMAFKTAAMLSMYILPFLALLFIPMNPWIGIPLVILMGIGSAGIGMSVMHDAVHGSYSNNEKLNKNLGRTIYLLGNSVFTWKMQHNVFHHAYTNIEGFDDDIAGAKIMRLSEHAPLLKIHRFQHIHAFFFYGLLTIAKLLKDFVQLWEFKKAGVIENRINVRNEYLKMIFVKIVYLFVTIALPILVTPFAWWQVVLGFFIMHWTAGSILSTIFQMAHIVEGAEQFQANEQGVIEKDWAVHELLTTANFARNNRFLNWYIGGLNFQIEHHLFPKICHVHYSKISPIVEKTAQEFGIPYNVKPTFLKAFASHVRRLKELGRTPAMN
jgi:linoleoyl-CoA desaturase